MTQLQICQHFAKGQCRFGDNCHDSHDPGDIVSRGNRRLQTGSNSVPIGARIADAGAGHSAQFNQFLNNSTAPLGYCRQHWSSGHCIFGIGCRHKHETSDTYQAARSGKHKPTTTTTQGSTAIGVKAFPDMASVASEACDALLVPTKFFALSKVQATFKEATTRKIGSVALAETFLLALNASNKLNELWTWEDKQSVLTLITKDSSDLLLRFGEIIRWPVIGEVSSNRQAMSFHGCYMGWIALTERFFTCETVVKSAAYSAVSSLYALVDGNLDRIVQTLRANLQLCDDAQSYKDPTPPTYLRDKVCRITSGVQVFKPIITLFLQYIERYRSAPTTHPELQTFVQDLSAYFDSWADGIKRDILKDALADKGEVEKDFFITRIRKDLKTLLQTVERALPSMEEDEPASMGPKVFAPSFGVLAALTREYDGPGELCEEGSRHDNDHANIKDIQIPPTTDELLCPLVPYVPANIVGAPHHLPADSMDKILDIQFRLLRDDAMTALRTGIHLVLDDLNSADYHNTQIANIMRKRGGRFTSHQSGGDSVMLPIITNIEYRGLGLNHKHGLVIDVRGDAPPGPARSTSAQRRRFWEQGKRLPLGGLVALITKEPHVPATVSLAVLTTFPNDIKTTEGSGHISIEFGLCFVSSADGLRAAETLRHRDESRGVIRFLLESPVLYESVRPFLEGLQRSDPLRLPFADYIRHTDLTNKNVNVPAYAGVPGFTWNMQVLLTEEYKNDTCLLEPGSEVSVRSVRESMRSMGKLDPSQSDAVIDVLTREVGLIQGPPGTGKTFTGVELLRLLFANNVGPVVLLAFTNHALDHIMRAVHDGNVTKDMVRLGSRSKDEVISQYNLETLEKVQPKTSFTHEIGKAAGEMKKLSLAMHKVSIDISRRQATEDQILDHLKANFPDIFLCLEEPTTWIHTIYQHAYDVSGWETVGGGRQVNGMWSFWRDGLDLQHLKNLATKPPKSTPEVTSTVNQFAALEIEDETPETEDEAEEEGAGEIDGDEMWSYLFVQQKAESWEEASDTETDSSVGDSDVSSEAAESPQTTPAVSMTDAIQDQAVFCSFFGFARLPAIPQTDRDLDVLLEDGDIWSFSFEERKRVAEFIAQRAKSDIDEDSIAQFEMLMRKHAEAKRAHEEAVANRRVSMMQKVKLLGSTTTGAAKLVSDRSQALQRDQHSRDQHSVRSRGMNNSCRGSLYLYKPASAA